MRRILADLQVKSVAGLARLKRELKEDRELRKLGPYVEDPLDPHEDDHLFSDEDDEVSLLS